MMDVYIWNQSTLIKDTDVQAAVTAIQKQVLLDFTPAWQVGAQLHFVPGAQMPSEGSWIIRLVDKITVDGALGYHEDANVPSGVVGVQTCIDANVTWSSCLSHETLELIADPEAVRCFQVDDHIVALEVADAVEGVGYQIDGIEVSDFCLPAYFISDSKGPWNFLKTLPGPFPSLLPNGYLSSAPVGDWSQTNAEWVRASKFTPAIGSRRSKRYR